MDSDLVGLVRLELTTSPLSGVRSSHLSYRPSGKTGGADRDRTDGLLNANQALSQLSYSPEEKSEAGWMLPAKPVLSGGDPSALNQRLRVQVWTATAFTYWPALGLIPPGPSRLPVRTRSGGTPSVNAATFSLRKEVIQPQVLLRLPCYDFTPIMNHTLDLCLLAVSLRASSAIHFRDVTGGVYKARERIHGVILIRHY